jgi:hypothetical protein
MMQLIQCYVVASNGYFIVMLRHVRFELREVRYQKPHSFSGARYFRVKYAPLQELSELAIDADFGQHHGTQLSTPL